MIKAADRRAAIARGRAPRSTLIARGAARRARQRQRRRRSPVGDAGDRCVDWRCDQSRRPARRRGDVRGRAGRGGGARARARSGARRATRGRARARPQVRRPGAQDAGPPVERFDDALRVGGRADGRADGRRARRRAGGAPSSGCCTACSCIASSTRPVAALVNPEIEWTGRELETMEEGCLSLPGVLVDVERPVHVRVRARRRARRAAGGRGLGSRGAGDPARDRSPRRGADPRADLARAAQGGDPGAPRGRAGRLTGGR